MSIPRTGPPTAFGAACRDRLSAPSFNFPSLSASKDNALVDSLCIRPAPGQRRPLERVYLCPQHGVRDSPQGSLVDRRWQQRPWTQPGGPPDPRIQVSLANTRILNALAPYGPLTLAGDNIVADMDLGEANMPVGQRLKVGQAVIEVSEVYNDACGKFAARYGQAAVDWIREPVHRHLRLRGLFATVVEPGWVALGDQVRKC